MCRVGRLANVNEEDILLREELDKLAKEDSAFRVHYVLNNPPEGWKGATGFVTPELIKVRRFFADCRRIMLTVSRNISRLRRLMSSFCFAARRL